MNLFDYCDQKADSFFKKAIEAEDSVERNKYKSLYDAFYHVAWDFSLMSQEEFNKQIPF